MYNDTTNTYTTLDDPLGVNGTVANGISGNLIVGAYIDSIGHAHGFVYNDTTNTYTTLDDPLGVTGTVANGISGNTVVGIYADGNDIFHGFQTAAVPELSSMLGFGSLVALGALALLRRRPLNRNV